MSIKIPVSPLNNRLILRIPKDSRGILLNNCEVVKLARGDTLCEAGKPYSHVYFPITGGIALIITLSNSKKIEQGGVGCEGMLGATLALGPNTALMDAVVQSAGTAMRMASGKFSDMLSVSPVLMRVVLRYLYAHLAQLSQNSACTYFHSAEMRVARCLLTTNDQTHADQFYLTHSDLAKVLGLRRSSVTTAAGAMQRRKLIHYSRGEIRILDRIGLEGAACECYSVFAALHGYAAVACRD